MQQATDIPDTAPTPMRPEAKEALGIALIGSALDLAKATIAEQATANVAQTPHLIEYVIDEVPEVQDTLAALGAMAIKFCPTNMAYTTLRQAADELAHSLVWEEGDGDHQDTNVRACRLKILAECAKLRLDGAI